MFNGQKQHRQPSWPEMGSIHNSDVVAAMEPITSRVPGYDNHGIHGPSLYPAAAVIQKCDQPDPWNKQRYDQVDGGHGER